MQTEHRKLYIAGAALMLAALAFILAVFSLSSRTDKADLYLADTSSKRFGWRYDLLVNGRVQAYEPAFQDDYTLALPEGTQAVRITRPLTENIPSAELEWMTYLDGVEVFLGGDLLHTDFPELIRDADGFVHPTPEQWSRLERRQGAAWNRTRTRLPENYLGQELCLITYFPENGPASMPEYPFLGREDAHVATPIVLSVRYIAVMTIYALLALLMAGIFLLDIHNNNADGKIALLCLYFLLLFLNEAYSSDTGYYSVLSSYLDLQFLRSLYMAPLYLYLALRMTGWWKWPLCGGTMAWALYEGVREYLRLHQNPIGTAGSTGPGALVVFLAVTAAFCAENMQPEKRTRQNQRRLLRYGLIAAAVTVLHLLGRIHAWGSLGAYLTNGIWVTLRAGNYEPIITLTTDIISYVTVIAVIIEAVIRTAWTLQTVDVLRERSRLTLAGYERVLRAEEATNAANHEMRHHMAALAGLLQDGKTERAREYILSVTDALDRLPTVRYSPNILVDTIAGTYLDQAKALGVRVECSLRVPAELGIPDEDISVFLTNLLENALHACQRLDPAENRYIRLKMAQQENFLFISCANSAPHEQEADVLDMEERVLRRHGYGLEAMRQIAEKYGSMLLIERTEVEFSLKSNLNLRPAKTSPSGGLRSQ